MHLTNEQKVNAALAALPLTRIMVAHRPETINAARRIIAIQNGKAIEVISNHGARQSLADCV